MVAAAEDTDQLKDYIARAHCAAKVDLDQWIMGCILNTVAACSCGGWMEFINEANVQGCSDIVLP